MNSVASSAIPTIASRHRSNCSPLNSRSPKSRPSSTSAATERVIIALTHAGLIIRTNVSSYRALRRGGKGVIGMATRESSAAEGEQADFIEHLFTASTHDYLMFFTTTGRVYVERVHEIPDMGRAAKGRSIANLLELKSGETIA